MTETFTPLTTDERRALGREFFFLPIYPVVYSALRWHYKTYNILSPEEVWQQAIRFSNELTSLACPELEVEEAIEQLEDFMPSTDAVFLVALAASYRLYPITVRDSTVKEVVTIVLNTVVKNHPHRDNMLERIAYSEDDAKLQKYRVDIVNYQLIDISVEKLESPRLLFIERQRIIGEEVNEAIEMGLDSMQGYLSVLTSVNQKHEHVFDEQLNCLIQGIKDIKNDKKPVQYIFNVDKIERLIDSHGTYIERIKDYNPIKTQ